LALELEEKGVYVLYSSGPAESAYESSEWKHGAFTLALLRALARPASDGLIYFSTLVSAVPEEMVVLMRAANHAETEQQPRVRAIGPPRVPIAQGAR
jgi:uncharacterized caspase-like protein